METILLSSFCVGGATIIGGALGLIFRRTSRAFCDAILSFAAGVMLAAAIIGLVLPSVECGGVLICVVGIILGAICVNLLDLIVPRLALGRAEGQSARVKRVFVFVMAIALHNLPEGVAAGVGIGAGDLSDGFLIATAIALQNLPEGMIVSVAMLGVGVKRGRAFLISTLTGLIEIFGSLFGYFAASISNALLPFLLAFAGGTMLYVISEEMIPETHSGDFGRLPTYFLLIGFCLMLLIDAL